MRHLRAKLIALFLCSIFSITGLSSLLYAPKAASQETAPPCFETLAKAGRLCKAGDKTGNLAIAQSSSSNRLLVAKATTPAPNHQPKGTKQSGKTYGDPHLTTFDGYSYFFHLIGEFILSKSEDEFFEIQTRQSALPSSNSVAINTAAAMRIGDTRITLYADNFPDSDTSTPLRINGDPVKLGRKARVFDNGGKIHKERDNAYIIEWPTGETVAAQVSSGSSLSRVNIFVDAYDSQANKMVGLLGNINGNQEDDLRLRNGTFVPAKQTKGQLNRVISNSLPGSALLDRGLKTYFDRLTKEYGNDWRVKPEESLFDYAPGQTTETFTIQDFPKEYVTLDMLPQKSVREAQQTCIDQNVDPEFMEDCVYDVAYSGYGDFARAAAQFSKVSSLLRDLGVSVPNRSRWPIHRPRFPLPF